MAPGKLSLKGRALRYLALREHSRAELARKLRPHVDPEVDNLEAVLDGLAQAGWLSDTRFAESMVRRRGARYGVRRLQQELGQHDLTPEIKEHALTLARSAELQTAQDVWARRFGAPATDARGRAAQLRFLQQRGFSPDVIRKVLRGASDPDFPEPDSGPDRD